MNIVTIPLIIPSTCSCVEKILKFNPPGTSKRYPVVKKRFPGSFIQLWVAPFNDPKYQYLICVKAKSRVPLPYASIHEHNCLVDFWFGEESINGNLYVQLDSIPSKEPLPMHEELF